MLRTMCVPILFAAAVTTVAVGQSRNATPGRTEVRCGTSFDKGLESYCETWQETAAVSGPLDIDARPNGGIEMRGADRRDALVKAEINAHADTIDRARRLASGVRIVTTGGRIHAEGPLRDDDEYWGVSFEIEVPRRSQLTLNTRNGGISIRDFQGTAAFHGRNGGVLLDNVSGDIRGETTNGGVVVDLRGTRWDGAGLDVETRNGGVRVLLPDRYSAELEAGTVNGRIDFNFPITVSGNISRRQITTRLGSGGPRIRAYTRNGGVTIERR